jgi:hypothetical protein
VHRDGNPDIGGRAHNFARERGRRHTDDRHGAVVDDNGLADNRLILMEASRPVAMTDGHDGCTAGRLILAAIKHTPAPRGNPEHAEIVARDKPTVRVFQLGGAARLVAPGARALGGDAIDQHVQTTDVPRREHARKWPAVIADVPVQRIRQKLRVQRPVPKIRDERRIANGDELLGMRHREGAHDDGVNETEDCGIGADADREHARNNGRETGVAAKRPQRVDQVLPQLADEIGPRHGLHALLIERHAILPYRVDIPELPLRFCACSVGCHSARDQSLDAHFEMEREFVVHVSRDVGAFERQPEGAAHVAPQPATRDERRTKALLRPGAGRRRPAPCRWLARSAPTSPSHREVAGGRRDSVHSILPAGCSPSTPTRR